MFSEDELLESWERVRANDGCAGVDGVSLHRFGQRAARLVAGLRERVSNGTYRALPLLKIVVRKKPDSPKLRTLLVPAVRDRVLQTAVAQRMSLSYEEEFLDCSFAYRPGRGVDLAVVRIRQYREAGYRFVVDADIQSYFDEIDSSRMLSLVRERESEAWLVHLVAQWIRGSFWDGRKVHAIERGIPQGSPVSPVLANLYLEEFDRELGKSGCKLIRYSDDFVLLARTRAEAEQGLHQTGQLLNGAGLRLHPDKTSITDFDTGFRFLGVYFHKDDIWAPWKNEKPKGQVVFVAPPMPAADLRRFEYAAPMSEMELELQRANLPPYPRKRAVKGDRPVAFLYLTEQGAILRKTGDRFVLEGKGETLLDIPYHKLEAVLLFGNIQVTSQAFGEMMQKGVPVSMFSSHGDYRGSMAGRRNKGVLLRIAQVDAWRDAERCLGMARRIVSAKIANGAAVLEKYRERDGTALHEELDARLRDLREMADRALEAPAHNALMGLEGAAARMYFDSLMSRFNKSAMPWPGRVKHPAMDPLNAMMSFTYVLMMAEFEGLAEALGLEPGIGFLHQVDQGRPSLALDLLEAFRHPAADRFVLATINQGIFDAGDFVTNSAGCRFSERPMKRFLQEYEKWMMAPREKGRPSYRDRMREDASGMREWVERGGDWTPFRLDREAEEGPTCSMSSVTI